MPLTNATIRPAALLTASLLVAAASLLTACGSDEPGQPQAAASSATVDVTVSAAPSAPSASPSPKKSAKPTPTPGPRSASGWPDAGTTGVQSGVKLKKRSGEILVTKSGTVIENLDLSGDIRVEANNVTIRNVRITNAGLGLSYWGIVQWMGYSGLRVEYVDIIGSRKDELVDGIKNMGGTATVRHSDISGISKKAIETAQGLVEENYLHDPNHFGAADGEVDMVRVTGGPAAGKQLIVRHNTALNPLPATSAVGLYSDPGYPTHDIVVENNYLGGGGYTLYAGGEKDPTYNVVIRGNVFSTKVKGTFGAGVFFNTRGKGNIWKGNKWENGKSAGVP